MAMLICGITLLSPKIQEVQADVVGTDGAQFILTGYSNNNPKSYFTDSKNKTTLINAQEKTPEKKYVNKKGQNVETFYYITGKHTSKDNETSSGVCEVYPSVEMQKIISAGQMSVKASCGLLALNDYERSKVNILIQIVAGGKVTNTLTLTSNKVSSNDEVFEPDWVETELVTLPTNTEKIIYSFESREATNRYNAAKFCIFEPTVFFATNLNECTISTESKSIKAGQTLKLSASNLITRETSSSKYFEYYKDIHKIKYEITENSEYAKIVGNYLYIDENIPFGTKIVLRAKCRKSSLSGEYIYSETRTFTFDIESIKVVIEKDFENPAKILGEGKYYIGDYATVSIQPNSGFEFVGWELSGNVISTQSSYTFKVEKNQKIKAKFKKTIKISKIVVKSKTYDGTTRAEFESVLLEGVEGSHDVKVEIAAQFATSSVAENKQINFSSTPTLSGNDSDLYNLEKSIPNVTGSITQKVLKIQANNLSKIYGESDPKLTFDAQGLVENEQVFGNLSRTTGEDVGEYVIGEGNIISQNPNYKIEFVGSKLKIEKREIVLTDIGVVSKAYDKNCDAQIFATTQNIVSGNDVSLTFDAKFSDENVGTNKIVKISRVIISGEDAKNYFVKEIKGSFFGTITAKKVTVSVESQTFCYGDDINIKYIASGLLGEDTLSGALEIPSNQVGTYPVSIGRLSNPNYEIILESNNVIISPKNISVSAKAATKEYGDADPLLEYVAVGLVGSDTLVGKIARAEGEEVGIYEIGIGTLNDDNYNINFIPANFEIKKRTLNVAFSLNNKTYDGTNEIQFSYTLKNTLEKDDVQVNIDLSFENAQVGDNKNVVVNNVEIVGENRFKYLANIDKNLLFASIFAKNVEIDANSIQKTYGESDPKLQPSFYGVVEGEQILGELSREKGEGTGKYYYVIPEMMNIKNANYALCLKQDITLTILPKEIDVKTQNKQKFFGDVDPEIEYIYDKTSFAFDDTFESVKTGSAKRENGEEIGRFSYEIGSLSFGANYHINYISSGILTIEKRNVTIKVQDAKKIYGEKDPTFVMDQENFVVGMASTIKLKREKGENVGTYKITYESLDDPHYNVTFISGQLEIMPCQISVKVENAFKHYNEEDPNFEFVLYQGVLQFDDELDNILIGAVSREAGEDVGEYVIGQGTLSAGENYSLTFISGILSIYVQEIVIKLDDVTKFYGDKDPNFDFTIVSGNVGNDAFSGKAIRQSGEDVGEYAIDIGTISLSLNFKLKFTSGKLKILPRQIEVTALPAMKIYGENDPAFTYEITSGSLVEESDLTGGLYRENVGVKIYENVGNYDILSTLHNENYEINYVGAKFSIVQREIVVSTNNYSSVYGDSITTIFDYDLDGEILDGDTISGGLYKTVGEGAGRYPIRCNINLGRNYKVKYVQAYYDILPKTLVVTLGHYKKTYSNPDPVYSLQILEGELVGDEKLEWEVVRDECDNVGTYDLTVVSLDENYSLTTLNSTLDILKKDVKLNLEVLDKAYDGTAICKIKNPIVSGLVDNEIMLDYDKNNCAVFASILPANNIDVTLLNFTLVGTSAENYNLLLPTGLRANITYSSIEEKNVEISTYVSTALKFGTTLNVNNIEIGDRYNGKKVLQSMNVGLLDENGGAIVVDNAFNMKIGVNNLRNYNNIAVYGKNAAGNYVKLNHQIDEGNLIISTSYFSDFIVVCDDESWIDIAVAVCVGMFLGIALCVLIYDMKKKKKQK